MSETSESKCPQCGTTLVQGWHNCLIPPQPTPYELGLHINALTKRVEELEIQSKIYEGHIKGLLKLPPRFNLSGQLIDANQPTTPVGVDKVIVMPDPPKDPKDVEGSCSSLRG